MAEGKKLLGMIGMCRKAGKTVIGVPMICEHMRKAAEKNKALSDFIVIEAADTSENTHKKISDKCIYYKVKHVRIDSSCEELGATLGKSAVAAVAIADASFCRAIESRLSELD